MFVLMFGVPCGPMVNDTATKGVSAMKWKPCKDLIAWGNKHLGEMPVGGVWAPDDSGVQYQKDESDEFCTGLSVRFPVV